MRSKLFGDVLFSKSTVTQRFQPSPIRRSFLTDRRRVCQTRVSTRCC